MYELTDLFQSERQKLYNRFSGRFEKAYNLNRQLVSFQTNKEEPVSRWFKYKEGFSSSIVKYFLNEYSRKPGKLLDPFAGVGTTLFSGQSLGWDTYGIEVLPVGIFVAEARTALQQIDSQELKKTFEKIWQQLENIKEPQIYFNHLSITQDAFPEETEIALSKFLTYTNTVKNEKIKTILKFAAFSILEELSYTRKDGQYLRWDYRSKRDLSGKPFNKGKIIPFDQALKHKLSQIISDLSPQNDSLFNFGEKNNHAQEDINLVKGTCLGELPKMKDDFFDFIITSPPYCNRYDYTRTYALELAYLGCDNERVKELRQELLSCTVENKEKLDYLNRLYITLGKSTAFENVLNVYYSSAAMNEINSVLDELNKLGKLNNNNIPRMVKNYFLELCFVIFEMARVLRSGGHCVMVNDNVRYGGEEIPVDLILSEFAEGFGFDVKKIFVLPRGKGNSSQQMGNFGRTEVRKCVYLWQKK